MKTYKIKSIFGPTIQGEGSHSGRVVNFLRFAGCNRWTGLEKDREKSICKFCDTDFRGGVAVSADEIVDRLLRQSQARVVVISGGEASLQLDMDLLQKLDAAGIEIHLETNGSRALGPMHELLTHITMSPKQALEDCKLEFCDDLKLLYPPIHPDITLEKFSEFPAHMGKYLQAVWDANYKAHLAATVCRVLGNPEWKLSLQTHKIIGVE